MNIADFLLSRIAEDEAVARGATVGSWEVRPYWFTSDGRSWATVPDVINEDIDATDAEHIARWDPARVLAECESKRQIIEAAWADHLRIEGEWGHSRSREELSALNDYPEVVRLLALPYADHEDYHDEWRP